MLIFRKYIGILILLCASINLRAQENPDSVQTHCIPVRTISADSLAFQAGERMEFILHFEWGNINTDVGTAQVRLDTVYYNGNKAFHCDVSGKTTKFFDFFFKVREDFDSWFSYDGFKPLKFTRDSKEGRYHAVNTYHYNWSAIEPVIVADLYSTKRGERQMELPLTNCTFALPALFFFARNMDFEAVEPGKKYPMTFAIDDDIYNVYFILYGRETKTIEGLGTIKTIKFGAKLLEGEVFKGDKDMTIWISDDDNRLPVLFEAPLLVGLATGRMTAYEGLKHPFTSFVAPYKRR